MLVKNSHCFFFCPLCDCIWRKNCAKGRKTHPSFSAVPPIPFSCSIRTLRTTPYLSFTCSSKGEPRTTERSLNSPSSLLFKGRKERRRRRRLPSLNSLSTCVQRRKEEIPFFLLSSLDSKEDHHRELSRSPRLDRGGGEGRPSSLGEELLYCKKEPSPSLPACLLACWPDQQKCESDFFLLLLIPRKTRGLSPPPPPPSFSSLPPKAVSIKSAFPSSPPSPLAHHNFLFRALSTGGGFLKLFWGIPSVFDREFLYE